MIAAAAVPEGIAVGDEIFLGQVFIQVGIVEGKDEGSFGLADRPERPAGTAVALVFDRRGPVPGNAIVGGVAPVPRRGRGAGHGDQWLVGGGRRLERGAGFVGGCTRRFTVSTAVIQLGAEIVERGHVANILSFRVHTNRVLRRERVLSVGSCALT